ncbi:hypothetical protein DYBT9275_00097 [Dyadobacter sp. CECT 9275]|uniref:HTH luxR-type domain-containing protein n=1 Tax=Dyadobacter helix TaxID=2822344 RepID=A0A916J7B3_9BACT|nr:LuxR C-terminal-related transcriptional regulator [Dyadobacter sp. CECT 9275]CAG4988510.1 hypothetical protein DYBT9275_00097 [Dyadobacter sp. CECT 9275]
MSENSLLTFLDNNNSWQDLAQLLRLTKREWEVVVLLSRGLGTSDIATIICVEPKSVDNYRCKIAGKLKLKGRNKLFFYCLYNRDMLEQIYRQLLSI